MFVCSNGNNDTALYSACPSTAINSLSISASNKYKDFSTYVNIRGKCVDSEYNNIVFGPNLYAPGDKIIGIPFHNEDETKTENIKSKGSGTSFSAPIVTGISALLMQEFPKFKTNIPELMCTLMATSNKLVNQNILCEGDLGFGIVNYENARKASNNSFTVKKGNTSEFKIIKLKKGDKM